VGKLQALEKIDKIEKEFPDQKNVFYAKEADHYHIPPKEDVYTKMEALIYHFKIIMGEIDAVPGEVYHSVEGGNGELGFYLISDGGRTPYRLHFRRPCFIYYQAYPEMVKDGLLSDAIITLSSLNVIAGELDG
jgi:NADH-quinone oxidoreductase subunit D